MTGGGFVWHLRCAHCLAAAVYSRHDDALDWAERHRCTCPCSPHTTRDQREDTQPSTTQPERNQP